MIHVGAASARTSERSPDLAWDGSKAMGVNQAVICGRSEINAGKERSKKLHPLECLSEDYPETQYACAPATIVPRCRVGGADSVALFALPSQARPETPDFRYPSPPDHRIRGSEGDADEDLFGRISADLKLLLLRKD